MAQPISNPLQDRTAIAPVAAPVNSFAPAARPAETNSLVELARSLSSLNPSLNAIADRQGAERRRKEANIARALAVKHQQLGIGIEEGMRDNTLTPEQYDLYTQTANTLSGNRAAVEYQERVLKDLSDPSSDYYGQDIEQLIVDKRREFFSGLNPVQAEGALDEWNRTEQIIRSTRRKVDADNLITGVRADYSVLTQDIFRKSVENGATPEEALQNFQDNVGLQASVLHGIPNSAKNGMIFEAVMNLADQAVTSDNYELAQRYIDVLKAPRKDALDPSKTVPPVATGELLSQLTNFEQTMRNQRDTYIAKTFDRQQAEAVYAQAGSLASAGKLYLAQDTSYRKADGSSGSISRTQQIEEVTRRYLRESQGIATQRQETPEQTFTREVRWFSMQGVDNPLWKSELQSGYKSVTTAALDTGVVPENAKSAFNLYRSLNSQAPTLLGGMLDEKSRQFYEVADIANKYLNQNEDASLATAFRATNDPSLRGRSVGVAKVEEALSSADSLVGSNTGTLTGEAVRLANNLLAAGLDEVKAVELAVERVRRNTVVINGWSVYSGNTSIPTDFKARAQGFIDNVWEARGKSLEDEGFSKEDLRIVNIPGNEATWLIQTSSGSVVGQFDTNDIIKQRLNEEAQLVDQRNRMKR